MGTKKYVRIKKARSLRNWYSVRIGKVYIVIGENEIEYITHVGVVLKEDAELIVTEKRKAAVGERVLITKALPMGRQAYKAGDVFEVAIVNNPVPGCIKVSGLPSFIDYKEYEVIVNSEVKNEEADEMENVNQTAIDSASTVFERVGDKYIGSKSRFGDILIGAPYSEAFVKAYANERKDVLVIPKTIEYTAFLRNEEMKKVATHGQAPIVNAQARRDEIVEQAKADVERLKENNRRLRTFNISLEVNRKDRSVEAVAKKPNSRTAFYGIVKAAPSDCFNVHIGKAIALRRALGLAVPDEYLNAPQPTEVRVGDVVGTPYGRGPYKLKKRHFSEIDLTYLNRCKIIDDSREEVGE
ncbi:hypothetical protein MOC78_03260 [Bacillus inaquosorum]|uniref:hypothetical protein n=1 Tax=Bacillus inaquosorum TaxID=483913 RepID=UPI00227F141A|nr:hypothetical protein [Bacillus inaquosorum]MCY8386496.1 hypothetical protein [Bacillus inaquosorum]